MTEAQPNPEKKPTPLELNTQLRTLYSLIPQGVLEQQLELHPDIDLKSLFQQGVDDPSMDSLVMAMRQRSNSRYDSELLERLVGKMESLLKHAAITSVLREQIIDGYKTEFSTGRGQMVFSTIKERIGVFDEGSGGIFDPELAKEIEANAYRKELENRFRATRLNEIIFGQIEEKGEGLSSPIEDVKAPSRIFLFHSVSLSEWRQAFIELHHQEP